MIISGAKASATPKPMTANINVQFIRFCGYALLLAYGYITYILILILINKTFILAGPDHMGVFISPSAGIQLTKWSLANGELLQVSVPFFLLKIMKSKKYKGQHKCTL